MNFTRGADAKQVSENTPVLLPSPRIAHRDFYIQGVVKPKKASQHLNYTG